jgi:thiamine pyrophosphokinase
MNDKMTGLIVTGGKMDLEFAGLYLKNQTFDKVIAVDGGLAAIKRLALVPDCIVGDFDTVSPEILEEYVNHPGITWDVHKPEKDETDTELAINTAIKIGCTEVVILGATGGRMDHCIGNIHLLYACVQQGVQGSIIDENNRITILRGSRSFHAGEVWGNYISFLPLTEEVKGITLTGFKYPLTMKDISIGTSLCISNELVEETGTITFTSGVLICVESHD